MHASDDALIEAATRDTEPTSPIVIEGLNQAPALKGLALYVGLASLPLGAQGIELQVQVADEI